jgi:hypothetical protein
LHLYGVPFTKTVSSFDRAGNRFFDSYQPEMYFSAESFGFLPARNLFTAISFDRESPLKNDSLNPPCRCRGRAPNG